MNVNGEYPPSKGWDPVIGFAFVFSDIGFKYQNLQLGRRKKHYALLANVF